MTLESKQADKGTFIDAIDAFYEIIGENEDAHFVYNEFRILQKNLTENYTEAKGSYYVYGSWTGDYDAIIFITYVDFEGGLHSDTIELHCS